MSAYFTAAGKQRELAALLARRVALRHDVPLELLISLGRARSVVPGMEEAALMTLLQAQSASPDNPEVFALIIDLMARQNDWASVLAAHEGWLSYKGASASLSEYLVAVEIATVHQADPSAAIRLLLQAAELTGQVRECGERLASIARTFDVWDQLVAGWLLYLDEFRLLANWPMPNCFSSSGLSKAHPRRPILWCWRGAYSNPSRMSLRFIPSFPPFRMTTLRCSGVFGGLRITLMMRCLHAIGFA